jgi:hypothetical protein
MFSEVNLLGFQKAARSHTQLKQASMIFRTKNHLSPPSKEQANYGCNSRGRAWLQTGGKKERSYANQPASLDLSGY